MERKSHYPSSDLLDYLSAQSRNSPIIPVVLPLFNALDEEVPYLTRSNETYDGVQLQWQQGAERDLHFEQLSLTLARNSLALTISIDHHHNRTGDENFSHPALVIENGKHTVYKIPRQGGGGKEFHDGQSIDMFRSTLFHTMSVLSLRTLGQNSQRRAS